MLKCKLQPDLSTSVSAGMDPSGNFMESHELSQQTKVT